MRFLLMTSINIVANHVNDSIIHNTLRIDYVKSSSIIMIFSLSQNEETQLQFEKCRVLIIDKIFMINAKLLFYISSLCVILHKSFKSFKKLHVIIFDDFMQLLSIKNEQIFKLFA